MTTRLSIWQIFNRPDLSLQRICPSDSMFCLFARILISDWVILIRRPGRSVPVIWWSVFLWGSWFPIGLSWFVVPEDLSYWFDVPYFCEVLDFWLGCPDLSTRRICPSDSMFRLFARILISNLVVLIRCPGISFPVIRSSDNRLILQWLKLSDNRLILQWLKPSNDRLIFQ